MTITRIERIYLGAAFDIGVFTFAVGYNDPLQKWWLFAWTKGTGGYGTEYQFATRRAAFRFVRLRLSYPPISTETAPNSCLP